MTEREMTELFSKYPFQDAKRMLVEECEKNGVSLMGHETVFELRNMALISNVFEKKVSEQKQEVKVGSENNENRESHNSNDNSSEEAEGNVNQEENKSEQEQNQNKGNEEEKSEKENENIESEKEEQGENKESEVEKGSEAASEQEKESKPEQTETKNKKGKRGRRKSKLSEENTEGNTNQEKQEQNKNRRHYMTDEVVKRLRCLHKAFLVGPAGTGKSTLAICSCRELFGINGSNEDVVKSGKFAQISFSPDTISADIIGFTDVNGVFHETEIVKVFRDGGVILFDEMDDADAAILVKLNTMLANRIIATPNGIVVQNENTYIVGTANTYGTGGDSVYVGRNRLDGSTLDRWRMATIRVDYDTELEEDMMKSYLNEDDAKNLSEIVHTTRKIITENKWRYICSTRFVEDSCKMIHNGYNVMFCLNTLMMSWNELHSKTIKVAVNNGIKKTKGE